MKFSDFTSLCPFIFILWNLSWWHYLTIFYNTSSVHCTVCSRPLIKSPFITSYPLSNLLRHPDNHDTIVCVHEYFCLFVFFLCSIPPPPRLVHFIRFHISSFSNSQRYVVLLQHAHSGVLLIQKYISWLVFILVVIAFFHPFSLKRLLISLYLHD